MTDALFAGMLSFTDRSMKVSLSMIGCAVNLETVAGFSPFLEAVRGAKDGTGRVNKEALLFNSSVLCPHQ